MITGGDDDPKLADGNELGHVLMVQKKVGIDEGVYQLRRREGGAKKGSPGVGCLPARE